MGILYRNNKLEIICWRIRATRGKSNASGRNQLCCYEIKLQTLSAGVPTAVSGNLAIVPYRTTTEISELPTIGDVSMDFSFDFGDPQRPSGHSHPFIPSEDSDFCLFHLSEMMSANECSNSQF